MPSVFAIFFFKSGFITVAVSNARRTREDEPGQIFLGVKKEEEKGEEEEDVIDKGRTLVMLH